MGSLDSRDGSLTEPLLGGKPEIYDTGFFRKLTFSWMNSLLRFGFSKPLHLDDIPALCADDRAGLAHAEFARAWVLLSPPRGKEQENANKNRVLRAVLKVHYKENIPVAIFALLRIIAIVGAPLILYAFVDYAQSDEQDVRRGLAIVACLVVSKVVESLSQRHWFFGSRRSGMRIRSALMVAVYEKQLKLSSSARRRHSTGEIVNYVAVDAYRMGEFPWWFHLAWSCGLQLFMAIAVLVSVVGVGALPGLIPLFACVVLNVPFAKALQKCQREFMAAQDERLRATSEILNSMKIIKLQSWEEQFKGLIESHRSREFRWLTELQIKKVFGTFLYWMAPTVVSSAVFFGCILLGGATLDAGMIFTVLATLRSMAEPVRFIPEALTALIQVKVSFDRLESLLLDDELGEEGQPGRKCSDASLESSIEVREGVFGWEAEASTMPTLRGLDLRVVTGQKIAVCGPVGAGKSSLLYAVLGEIPKLSGSVEVLGSIAYVSQTSWIQSGTIRENILYGKAMEKERYDSAIEACALESDINGFDHGDLTEIGQRGINMSGGQKQRIQLARAVYSDADIYLLDDPFSAVDAQTAAVLFNECVMSALRRKTVILVTHQVEFLSSVDRILVMEGGIITQSGSYAELLEAGTAFEQLVNAHKDSVTTLAPSNNESQGENRSSKLSSKGEVSVKGPPGVQLTQEEEKGIGDLGLKPFRDYISVSNGTLFLSLSIVTLVCFVALQAVATYWLALGLQIPSITNVVLVAVYSGISLLCTVFVYLRSFFSAHLGLKASKAFFSGFTDSLFRAPMLFFDSTPVGRILTRAASDLSVLDNDIPFALVYVLAAGVEYIGTIGIMASVTWQVLVVATFSIVASKYVQDYYLATARELVRINGTTKAPITNFVSESSLGAVTIRAFRSVDRFFQSYLKLVDTDAALFFLSNASIEWVVLRIEVLQNLTLFTAAFFLVLLPKGQVPAGLVGLSLSYALSLTGTHIFMTRWYCNLSNYIVSVERIKQFMHIPPEPPAIIEANRPPPSWPSKGRIELRSLEIRYRTNSPLVLKGISCTFKEGTRVGVVGRTGSGKTTLISALFRLVEPTRGKIVVDGIDICSIGLRDLRMKLSIIPQEPTLFKGSIRTNLDPLGLYSDDQLWSALEKCQLKATVSSLPKLLDSSVSDEGENWSAGQRQLFCLGRVLLKRNRILVLDEATASIDFATDAILQRIIREEFADCTVVTVAHRVPTVIDSDMVMVLSYGTLVEYDEPSKLIDANSYFAKLVAEYWSSCKRNSQQIFEDI